jgi:hypothetical protein
MIYIALLSNNKRRAYLGNIVFNSEPSQQRRLFEAEF